MSEPRDDTARRLGLGLGGASAAWVVPSAESLADAIPGHRVLELAGRGGMGAVYRAEQVGLGRTVAVKILPRGATGDPAARDRFEREARLLAGLRHPHVLQVFEFGALADGTPFLVTEWAEGGDLGQRIGNAAVAPAQAMAWVAQIAAALDAAHARGVVHRDLKPANVLVRGDGSLALGDFGLARAEGPGFTTEFTMSGVVFGTFDYMAPEQMEGAAAPVSPTTDVYALGVMTYRLLTGRAPRGVFVPASRLAPVSARVDAVIAAALANEPSRRPASAGEFARRLEGALRGGAGARGVMLAASLVSVIALAMLWLWIGRPSRGVEEGGAQSNRTTEGGAWSGGATAGGVEERVRAPLERGLVEPAPAGSWGKASVLPAVRPEEHAVRGRWWRRGDELLVGEGVGLLRLPVVVPESGRYDLVVDFTRLEGRHSVGVILPTRHGVATFELDAWEQHLGGLQEVDGRDLRNGNGSFPARLENGQRQQLHLVVESDEVSMNWNGVHRGTVSLRGRRLSIPDIWSAGVWTGLGLCTWESPTVFHRVEIRAR